MRYKRLLALQPYPKKASDKEMKALTKWKITVLLFTALLANFANAQTITHTCGSDHKNDSLAAHDPMFARSLFQLEQAYLQQMEVPSYERTNEVYVLPVVVHVIHEGEAYGMGSNITDEQIFSAINALNDDFRKVAGTNGDGAGVDIGIEFCLASRNPSGQPSTGINRVNGSSVALYADQGIESSGSAGADEASVKALSTWPRDQYINIWIVNEIENNDAGSGVQGYAYFPVNSPIDGIVILHNAFGTVGNLKSYTNLNRTLTHEMGHCLGLYHTFHETTTCGAETNCATAGDRVCDTPVTILSTSCSSPACSGTQQVANYLDYTSQTCQDMFSEGQKTRMRTTLETQRASLITSLGCMPVYTRDAGITAVLAPTGTSCNTSYIPQVTLTNFGSASLTSVTINYNVDGVGNTTYSWTGNISSGSSSSITLPAITTSLGNHIFYAFTSNPNNLSDENSANNQSTSSFIVTTGSTMSLSVQVDYFGAETTWAILDEEGNQMDVGGPYSNNAQGTIYTESLCLPDGCYDLVFYDAYGDGMGFTNGQFNLYDDEGTQVVHQQGNWGAVSTNPFCVTGAPAGSAPTATFTVNDNLICRNSSVNFTYTGANGPTSYSWTFPGAATAVSSQANPSNIAYNTAGTYSVTLTVSNDFGSNTYTCNNCITVTAPPTVTLTSSNPTCNGSTNGSFTAAVTGGNSPYQYSWNNGQTTANISGLGAGSYTLTVTDAQGCIGSGIGSLTAPSALSISSTINNVSCSGDNNGAITLNATGGTGTKTYSWSNGMTGAAISNLSAGSYTVQVSDANGCSATQSFTISQPSPVSVSVFHSDASCYAYNDGTASASATGGTGAINYSWSNGMTGTITSGLAAGTYIVTATDANGCTDVESFIVEQPSMVVASVVLNSPETCAGNDGSATVDVDGGNGDYVVIWGDGTITFTASGLSSGDYFVSVADINGCALNLNVTIPYDCEIETPTTRLIDTDCGATGLALTSVITCETVSGAEMYQWKFASVIGQIVAEEYTIGPQFYLSQASGIQNNMDLVVVVKALVDGTWGPYGDVCSIGTEQVLGTTSLTSEDCGSTITSWNSSVEASLIENALTYEWHITGNGFDQTFITTDAYLSIDEDMAMINGEAYVVEVRCMVEEGVYTSWGDACEITLDINVSVGEIESDQLSFYPNPCDGEKINFNFSNLSRGGHVEDFKLYNSQGSLIENMSVFYSESNSHGMYRFNTKLASGIYIIQYTRNGVIQEEKLVVR
ncbi:MAG: M43 family zinc metalloprotease [Flavobacteriales bacterium]